MGGKTFRSKQPCLHLLWKMNKDRSNRHGLNTKCVNVIGYHLVAYMVHIQMQSV